MKLFKRPKTAKKQYWYARVRLNGKDRWISSKCQVGKYTKEEAESKIQKKIDELKNESKERPTRPATKVFSTDNPPLWLVAQEFVKNKKNNNKYSWYADMYVLNGIVRMLEPEILIREIDWQTIEEIKEKMREINRDLSVNQKLKVVRAMFNRAISWGVYPGPNPVKEAGLITIKDTRQRRQYTQAEIKQLLLFSPAYFKDWINSARWCGMRRTELWKAHESHVNFKERYIYVPPSKSAEPRQVPLEEPAIKMFERLVKNSRKNKKLSEGYLFLNRKGARFAYPPLQVSKIFNTIRKKAGIADGCFHSLRHTAASRIINKGGPTPHAKYLLGHKSIQTTMIYTHVDESVRKTASLLYDPEE